MKYRKKPVVIDALQWTGTNHREMFDFLTDYQCTDQYMSAEGKNFYIDHWKVPGGWLLRRLRANIWRILVIISSAVFTANFIRVSQIYSEKLMRRWKHETCKRIIKKIH